MYLGLSHGGWVAERDDVRKGRDGIRFVGAAGRLPKARCGSPRGLHWQAGEKRRVVRRGRRTTRPLPLLARSQQADPCFTSPRGGPASNRCVPGPCSTDTVSAVCETISVEQVQRAGRPRPVVAQLPGSNPRRGEWAGCGVRAPGYARCPHPTTRLSPLLARSRQTDPCFTPQGEARRAIDAFRTPAQRTPSPRGKERLRRA